MDKSIADLVVDELIKRRGLVKDELVKRYKRTKPFRAEPVSVDEQLNEFNTRGFEIFAEKADKEGLESAIKWRDGMEELNQRRFGYV